jgi:hypothetical protein
MRFDNALQGWQGGNEFPRRRAAIHAAETDWQLECWGRQFESDGQMKSDNDSDEELQSSKEKRKWFGRREFTLIKRWVTARGDKAEMDSKDIERELFELARDWMSQSKPKKLPGPQSKPIEVSLWKQNCEYKVQKGTILI